jgi:type IV secretion system protein VirD4
VAFAANDDRTAKRVSDALGTATEQRSMKNYAGHRLSPWLGHVMISRTETARPLMTPGEVQQFSPDEEIVFVASTPPIRAEKARYYLDPRFRVRLLPPPKPMPLAPASRPKDDWTALAPVAAPPMPRPGKPSGSSAAGTDEAREEAGADRGNAEAPSGEDKTGSDTANAGIRREPGLGEHEEVVPPAKAPTDEHTPGEDTQDDDAARAKRQADRAMRGGARNASLDPDDGIVL